MCAGSVRRNIFNRPNSFADAIAINNDRNVVMMIAKMRWLICRPITARNSTGGTSSTLAVFTARGLTLAFGRVVSGA